MDATTARRSRPALAGRLTRSRAVGIALGLQKRYSADSAGYLAAAIAYYGFLSLFPLVLLGLSAVGFFLASDPAARAEWALRLAGSLPGLESLVGDSIETVVRGRAASGIVGLAGLAWSGLGVVEAATHALAVVWRRERARGLLRQKARALGRTAGLGLVALAGAAFAGFAGGIQVGGLLDVAWRALALAISFGIDVALFLTAYRLLTPGTGPSLRALRPGAVLAGAGWTLLKFAGAWFASRTVEGATAVYGTFASVIGVLVLMYLAARLFLYGAELNAVLDGERGGEMKDRVAGARRPPQDLSTPDLLRSIAGGLAALVRKEIDLAKAEVTEAVAARAKGVGALAAAAALGLFALGFLGAAAASALTGPLTAWSARLVVATGYLLVAAGAALFGLPRLKSPSFAPQKARESVKEDVEWAREQLKR